MRDTDNLYAREDGNTSPPSGTSSERTALNEVFVADKVQPEASPVDDKAIPETLAFSEPADNPPLPAERPRYLFWATILLLAAALSVFSFVTGVGNPLKSSTVQGDWLSIWQNTPNFNFLVTFFLIAAFLGFIVSCRDFSSAWTNIRGVLESGVFYFFAGLGLLLYAKQGTDAAEHPSITFILAMLGVAIMLFGTGSQAAGAIATAGGTLPAIPRNPDDVDATEETAAASTTSGDWSPFKANAVIAGGAAVLTAVFGFGVIYFADKIPGVFRDYGGYDRIMIRPCLADASRSCTDTDISSFALALSLADYSVSAENADGRELFIRKEDKTIQVLALKEELRSGQYISLRFDRMGDAPIGILLAPSVSVDVPVTSEKQQSLPTRCTADSATTVSRCRLSRTDNGSFNRDDNTSLITFTLDLSGGVQPDKVSVQTTQLDPTSKAVKPVSYDLQ